MAVAHVAMALPFDVRHLHVRIRGGRINAVNITPTTKKTIAARAHRKAQPHPKPYPPITNPDPPTMHPYPNPPTLTHTHTFRRSIAVAAAHSGSFGPVNATGMLTSTINMGIGVGTKRYSASS